MTDPKQAHTPTHTETHTSVSEYFLIDSFMSFRRAKPECIDLDLYNALGSIVGKIDTFLTQKASTNVSTIMLGGCKINMSAIVH